MRLLRTILAAFLACVDSGHAQNSVAPRSRSSPGSRDLALDRDESRDLPKTALNTRVQSPTGDSEGKSIAATSCPRSRILPGFYCALIVGASLFGGWLPQRFELSHTRMQVIISLIAGLMLSIGIFHMLPHALAELGDDGTDLAAGGMMAGLVGMFLILRTFAFHQHSPANPFTKGAQARLGHDQPDPQGTAHHHAAHAHSLPAPGTHSLTWVGVCLGMGIHSLIDGLALGANVESDALQGVVGLFGLGTFLAVFLHKPIDSVSITSLMATAGWSSRAQSLANSAFALICPLGAGLFVLGLHEFSGYQSTIVGCALATSAGVFLCIALSDLLPEIEFHSHNRVRLTAALLVGIMLGWAIHFLDRAHAHSHGHAESTHARPE